MRNILRLIPPSFLLTQAACSMRPMEASMPRPADVLLRVTTFASCLPGGSCPSEPGALRRGNLIFAEVDSLVMFDVRAMERVTIRPGAGVLIELYRGQRPSGKAVGKGIAKGAAIGVATGLGEALLVGGLLKLLGGDVDLGSTVREGVAFGAGSGAFAGGYTGAMEGEAVWERVTLLQLRQQLCRCPNPDPPKLEPAVRLIPEV